MNGFSINTDTFDGPMELLLRLIEKHEVDILDIPISLITGQYLAYMKELEELGMDALSDFLLMAATLLYIKSQMILPPEKDENNVAVEDPRADLARRLIYYKQLKEASAELAELEKINVLAQYRERDKSIDWDSLLKKNRDEPVGGIVPMERLRQIFLDVLARSDSRTDKIRAGFSDIPRERFTISDKTRYVTAILKRLKSARFADLFEQDASRNEKIVTFLAILELIKQSRVFVAQNNLFSDIICTLKE